MNIKFKAASITAVMMVFAVVISGILHYVSTYFTSEQIMSAISWGAMALLVFCIYKLVLTNLEHKDTLKKIQEIK